MSVGLSMWCIKCGGPPECTLSIERNGVIGHYGACLEHVHAVADRMLTDIGHSPPLSPRTRHQLDHRPLEPPAGRLAAIDVDDDAAD